MPVTAQALFDYPIPIMHARVRPRDAILYALSVGYGSHPRDPAHLRRAFGPELVSASTLANVVAHPGPWMKEAGVDWRGVVHAEQRLTVHRPLPLYEDLVCRSRMLSVVDRGIGKGMFATFERTIETAADGTVLATVVQTDACRFDGGCGSLGSPPAPLPRVPESEPDLTVCVGIREDAALLFRLNGDLNPLHADPAAARAAGFERPILHGLCTFGQVGHAIAQAIGPDTLRDPSIINARFTAPVFPGDTLSIDLWISGTDVGFRVRVAARNVTVLDCGSAHCPPSAM